MDKQHCIINPKTNRAVKIDSKLGKQILASQKDVKKEPHTQYKKPIGPVKLVKTVKPTIKKTITDNGNMDIVKFEKILEDLVKQNPNLLPKSVDILYLFYFDPKPSKFMKKLHNLDNKIPDTFQAVGKIYNNDTMKMERAFERIFLTEAEKNKVRKGWVNPRYKKTKEAKTEVKPKEINTINDLQQQLKKIAKEHPELNFMDYTIFNAEVFMDKLNKIDNRITYKKIIDIFNSVNKDWLQFVENLFVGNKPKEANTQYKEHSKVGPNKFTLKDHQTKMSADSRKFHRDRRDTQNIKERGDAYKKQVNDGFKNLVNEWDSPNIDILFYQIASDGRRENLQGMIRKIVNLEGKNKAIIPSELFAFLVNPLYKVNENLLDLLVDEYGADKKGIDVIDEGMRNIIKHIEPNAILPDEIDYKYYSKHMNAKNKAKIAKMITDKHFSKK